MNTLLIILDGFGFTKATKHNAIYLANTPNYDRLLKEYPSCLLNCSGEDVGLPDGVMGNSEVGHLNLGAGRIVYQDLTKINKYIREKGFKEHEQILRVAKMAQGALHLIGLLSDGGVHSHEDHLHHLLDTIHEVSKDKPIFLHIITDGRDTPPKSGLGFVKKLQMHIDQIPNVQISTVSGRFYAMDRDKRWDRIEMAYRALTEESRDEEFGSAEEAILESYKREETDEFIVPKRIRGGVRISVQDQLIFFNFRADRARELSMALAGVDFHEFETPIKIKPQNFVTMTKYHKDFTFPILFERENLKNILGEVISSRGYKQLRVAETEKYAHVTYFFNGGREIPFDGEDRSLVPSPKDVKTYDEKPEMSAYKIRDKVIEGLGADYKFIVVNFANGDMVGHTGNEKAAIRAVEVLDECLGEIVRVAQEKDFSILLTADHGNCEEMVDSKTGEIMTQHSMNPVPCLLISKRKKYLKLSSGNLSNVAPTILKIMGLSKPTEMASSALF